ncbi:hypothetical protein L0Z11_26235 [Burkholderia multivorans]|uniref:hypothetical protein n=1 Tax=Burkholderia multivorans TaxID=87883 RepID=UPI0020191862|nr:hypothetical protein [Burkholderia multivorans]UQN71767.1 hypothetical protein L0Z45_26205 [Burkholderia multivorans]UQN77503.1 hypothetical protein L0Z11_26235 [Burkholderia multivorans]
MFSKMKTKGMCLAVASAIMLTACGGGDGDGSNSNGSPPVPTPKASEAQGIYTGTTASGDTLTGVVLDTGAYYFVWVNGNSLGVVQGTSTASAGQFKSTDAKNFYIAQNTVLSDNITATYAAKSNISGSIAPASGNGSGLSFALNYSSVYDQAPSLSAIAGKYTGAGGSVKAGESVTLTISPDGTYSGSGPSGCAFSGNVKPHAAGNVYDVTVNFGSMCTYPGQSVTGVLAANNNTLIAVAPLSDRSDAFVLAAAK